MIFPVLYPSKIVLLLYEQVRVSTSRGNLFVFFGFVQQETSIWYHTICNVVFVVF